MAKTDRPINAEPHSVSLTILPMGLRARGKYEDRKPQGILHEFVDATLVGFRTYVQDGVVVTEAMVLPEGRNHSYGFLSLSRFVQSDATLATMMRDPDLDRPF